MPGRLFLCVRGRAGACGACGDSPALKRTHASMIAPPRSPARYRERVRGAVRVQASSCEQDRVATIAQSHLAFMFAVSPVLSHFTTDAQPTISALLSPLSGKNPLNERRMGGLAGVKRANPA